VRSAGSGCGARYLAVRTPADLISSLHSEKSRGMLSGTVKWFNPTKG